MWGSFKFCKSPPPETVRKMLNQVSGRCPRTTVENHPLTLCGSGRIDPPFVSWPGPDGFKPATVSFYPDINDWLRMDMWTNLSQSEKGHLQTCAGTTRGDLPFFLGQHSSRPAVNLWPFMNTQIHTYIQKYVNERESECARARAGQHMEPEDESNTTTGRAKGKNWTLVTTCMLLGPALPAHRNTL